MVPIEQRLLKSKGWDWQPLEELAKDMGYTFVSQSGSHRKLWHGKTKEIVIIPANRDLRRTSSGIVNQLRGTWKKLAAPTPPETPVSRFNHKGNEIMTNYVITAWKEKIRNIRESRKMTLREVGEKMGYGTPGMQIVYEFECRNRRFTTFEFAKWCAVFGLDPAKQTWMKEYETNVKIIAAREKKFGPFLTGPEVTVVEEFTPAFQEANGTDHEQISREVNRQMAAQAAPIAFLPTPVPAPAFQPSWTTRQELPQSDFAVVGELAINRFKELEKVMMEAEKCRPEYEKLKIWLTQGSEILGV